MSILWEALWFFGICHGRTIRAMVLGRGFDSRYHLKIDGKDGPLEGKQSKTLMHKNGTSYTKKKSLTLIYSRQTQ